MEEGTWKHSSNSPPPAIGTAAGAFTVVGIIYLGMTLAGLLRGGGGEIRKAVAIIVAGLTCIAFAHLYGY